jgi:LacI family transcriptional regulator
MSRPTQIAVLVETSTTWGSKVVRGVAAFAHEQGRWSIFVETRVYHERLRVPPGWRGEGIIARVTTRQLAREIEALRIPCVNVSWSHVQGSSFPQVVSDQTVAGRMAAEHFLDRGFSHFAYFGLPDQPHYIDLIGLAYESALSARGHSCAVYLLAHDSPPRRVRLTEFADLEDWLAGLPKPVGLLAWDSDRGRLAAEACASAGIRVPEAVGLLSGYNDDLMCEIATPPLSCVDHSAERVGREAAALLGRLLAGAPPPPRPILIPPAGVIPRRSTDALAIEDRAVADALQFIRASVHEPIGVDDLLDVVPCSRRLLELRFLRILGRSPAAVIRRVHVEHAMDLLARTDLPISEVAATSGFNHTEVLNRIFRREVGVTPGAYRRQFRHHAAPRGDPARDARRR